MDVNKIDGYKFEEIVAELLKKMGFSVEHTSLSGDNGIDIIAYTDQPIIKGKYVVQCKRWTNPVGEPVIRDLYGSMLNVHATKGILITNSSFSNKASQFADGKNIELIDGNALSKLFNKYEISISSTATTQPFIDHMEFDKEKYLYLKSRIENNRQERLYYDRLQQFYHSYIEDLTKYEINKNGLIDEYINFNNDYVKRFCSGTREDIVRKETALYINAFLYILKGDIFKSVEIYDDIGIFETNNSIWDALNCVPFTVKSVYGKENRGGIPYRVSILNLYSLFSYFGYQTGVDYILNKMLIKMVDRYSFYKEQSKELPPISQLTDWLGDFLSYKSDSLIPLKDYSIKKYDGDYNFVITIPSNHEWWNLSEVVPIYYEDNKIETIKKEVHKIDLILKDKKDETDLKIRSNGAIDYESINHLIEMLYLKVLKNKGYLLVNSTKYKEAIKLYDKAINLNSRDAETWYEKGVAFYNLKKYEEAIKCFNKAVEINPKDAEVWDIKGNALASLEKYEESIKCYDKAIEINPEYAKKVSREYAMICYVEGTVLVSLKKYEEAINYFSKAIKVNPEYSEALSIKGTTLAYLGKYQEAIGYLNKAIEINPEDAKTWYNKGAALSILRKHKEAIRCFSKAIEINPEYAEAWYGKGATLLNLKKYEEAIECLNKAIEINPKDAEVCARIWYNKGTAFYALGKQKQLLIFSKNNISFNREKLEKAILCFNKAIELYPEYREAWYDKACTYSLLEDKENALKPLQQAIKLDKKYKQKAMKDKDFTSLWSDEDFKRIVR